jgi:hypothetical protein
MGQPTPARSGVAGPTDSDDCRADASYRALAEKCPEARRLRTHLEMGALTALAFVLIMGRADRFQ